MSETEKPTHTDTPTEEQMELRKQEYEKRKQEYEKRKQEYEEKKREETISMILRQTDYDKETAIKKLKEWKNDYISVIKEFMNPKFKTEHEMKPVKSVNQNVMGEIRNFMDGVNKQYEYRKSVSEWQKQRRAQFAIACRQKLAQQIAIVKENWPDVPDECWKNIDLQKLLLSHAKTTSVVECLYGKTYCNYRFEKK